MSDDRRLKCASCNDWLTEAGRMPLPGSYRICACGAWNYLEMNGDEMVTRFVSREQAPQGQGLTVTQERAIERADTLTQGEASRAFCNLIHRRIPKERGILSLCPACYCMTYTLKGKCGKCGAVK